MRVVTKFIIMMFIFGSVVIGGLFCTTKYLIIPQHIDTLTQKASQLAYYIQDTAPHIPEAQLQKNLTELVNEQQDLSYIVILDKNGRALFHSDLSRAGMIFDDQGSLVAARDGIMVEQIYIRDQNNPNSIHYGERIFDILLPYYDKSGKHVGAVNVGLSFKRIDQIKNKYYQVLGITGLLLNIFLLFLVYRHFKSVLSPLSTIATMARRLGEGHPDHLIRINRKDEIGMLALEFNNMSQKITAEMSKRKRVEQELRAANKELTSINEELNNSYTRLSSLYDTTLDLMNRLDVKDLIEAIMRRAGTLLGTSHGGLYLINKDESEVILNIGLGIYKEHLGTGIKPGEGLSGKVWQTGEPLYVENYSTWSGRSPKFDHTVAHSVIAFPIKSKDKVVGVIGLAYLNKAVRLNNQEMNLMSSFAQLASIALENARLYMAAQQEVAERKKAEDLIRYQAQHDPLTNLPNRILFNDRLAQALTYGQRHHKYLAVMFLDLDSFKLVNDTMGHDVGDQLLVGIAKRLTEILRESDTMARIGGDEFTILLSELSHPEAAGKVAEKIIDYLIKPFVLNNQEFHVTTSIGIAVYPSDGEDVNTLLKYADIAMYEAKEQGRNTYRFFNHSMNEKNMRRLELENSLRKGLDNSELINYYQPQIDVETGEIIGTEALVRWLHPQRGLIHPAEFILVAEETGLIIPVGDLVLRNACMQNKKWQEAGLPELRMAVNLSARQFKQPNLVQKISRILEETGMEPQYLELEITESSVMHDVDLTIKTLLELRELGISIAIDDFGTGYSSLSYLKELPIDLLKIDRSFIYNITEEPGNKALVDTIIRLAHNLELKVIAEGVETEEQLAYLRSKACDRIQGYLFYKPMAAETLTGSLMYSRG